MLQNQIFMERNYKLYLFIFLTLVVSLICLSMVGATYRGTESQMIKDVNIVFSEVVDMDIDLRLKDSNMDFSFGASPVDPLQPATIEIDGHQTTHLENVDSLRQISDNVFLNNSKQSILLRKKPINIIELDNMFQSGLHERGIHLHTALQYTDNTTGKSYYSNPDSSLYKSYLFLGRIDAGVFSEISIQAYVKVTPFTIIRKAALPMGGITSAWIIFLITLVYIALRKPKVVEKEKIVEVFVTDPLVRSRIEVLHNLCLEADRNCFVYNGQEIELTSLITQFFTVLLSSPDKYVSYDEMLSRLYEGYKNYNKNSLDQLVARVRKMILPQIPCLKLITVPGKGYRLEVETAC